MPASRIDGENYINGEGINPELGVVEEAVAIAHAAWEEVSRAEDAGSIRVQ